MIFILGVKILMVKVGVVYVSVSYEIGDWVVGLSFCLLLVLFIWQDMGSMDLNFRGLLLIVLNLMGMISDIQLVLFLWSLMVNIMQDMGSLNFYLFVDIGLQVVIQNFGIGFLVVEGQEVVLGIVLMGMYKIVNYDSVCNRIMLNFKMMIGDVKVFKFGVFVFWFNMKQVSLVKW